MACKYYVAIKAAVETALALYDEQDRMKADINKLREELEKAVSTGINENGIKVSNIGYNIRKYIAERLASIGGKEVGK